jgi:hypothetical protein
MASVVEGGAFSADSGVSVTLELANSTKFDASLLCGRSQLRPSSLGAALDVSG